MKHAQQTIADLEDRLQQLNAESQKIKSAINCLCDVMGEPPKYELEDRPDKMSNLRADEYYGRPLATVVTQVLNKRKEANLGAATLDEIYNQLVNGGYSFTGKNDGIKKRGIAISMSKNKKFHHILSNDTWGLTEWYPDVKEKKETTTQIKEENGIVLDKNNEEELPKEEQ